MAQTNQLTPSQIKALAALREGAWMDMGTLLYQGHGTVTLQSLYARDLLDRDAPNGTYRFRINEAGRDAHCRRPAGS